MLIFDIETGSLPEEQLRASLPPFDESEVKLGNLKDPEKIKAKLEEAKANHEKNYFQRAALSPITGRVLAIGFMSPEKKFAILHDDANEGVVLDKFWTKYEQCREKQSTLVGFNILGFDVPFLVQRSWLLGVDVPDSVFERNRYLDEIVFIDLMKRWAVGQRDGFIKLDVLTKAMGLGGKLDGVNGAMFADLWRENRDKAEEYLFTDLEITTNLAARLGVV